MSNNGTSQPQASRDEQLSDLYAPKATPDHGNLIGITAMVRETGVVTDKDYDRIVAERAAAQAAPVANPTSPSVTPNTTALDITTARTSSGKRITDPADLTGGTIVTFDGIETTLATLMTIGAVTKDADGTYRPVTPGSTPQQAETTAPEANPRMDDASENILADAYSKRGSQSSTRLSWVCGPTVVELLAL
jgi:hypothetical protein